MRTFFICLLLFCSRAALAQEFPASWKFITLKTAHFDIIVNAEQQELGKIFAEKLEKAHRLVAPLFTDHPERTVVVIADKTDVTNGYATRLPYPHIFLYPVLPNAQDSLAEAGDWILELSAHEYTHIMTFEAVRGVMEPLQSVFGTILSPNLLLPRWWKEGVAVEVESHVAGGGRLQSAYQDGVIRSLVNEEKWDSIELAEINEALPDWPEGSRAYIFGSIFWSQAVADKGTSIIDQLHQRHGGRLPYMVEEPARDLLGMEYESFFRRAMTETKSRARKQILILRDLNPTSGETLPAIEEFAQYSHSPRFSPDERSLAFIARDDKAERSIRVLQRPENDATPFTVKNLKAEKLVCGDGLSRVSWFPNSKRLIFDKVDSFSSTETYSDLWSYDFESKKEEQLTHGLRAREPVVSPDGNSAVFTGLEGARTWLGRWTFREQKSERLWVAPWQGRISFPVVLPDGRIVFSYRFEGKETLQIFTPGEPEPKPLLTEFTGARAPEWTHEGLVFTSSRNGVNNLYLASSDFSSARPLSHVIGGAMTSTLDPKSGDAYITVLGSDGPEIRRIATLDAHGLPAQLPSVQPLLGDRYRGNLLAPATPETNTPPESEEYSSWSYLRPRYWFPMFGMSAVNGTLVFQASTSGFDPLKKQAYLLGAGYDSGLKKGSYLVSYLNNMTSTGLLAQSSSSSSYLVSVDNPITNDVSSITALPDLFHVNPETHAALSWQWRKTETKTSSTERTGPSLMIQYFDYSRKGWQISPESGGSVLAGVNHYVPGSNRLSFTQYIASLNFYFSKWLPKRNAISLRASSISTPDSLAAIYGGSTTNYFFQPDSPTLNFVMRGYRVGHFYGKTLNNANLEYRFPVQEIRRGRGTDPFYITRMHGAVFMDAVSTEGFVYRPKDDAFESVQSSRVFTSVGAEARVETTIGYFLPMNLIFGYAMPLAGKDYSDGGSFIFSVQLGALF